MKNFIMKHSVLLVAAIMAIMTITGLVSEVRAEVKHFRTISWINDYDADSLKEVTDRLVVENMGDYTITSFVTNKKVGINDLRGNKDARVFIRIHDGWADLFNGDGAQLSKKVEVRIYSSGTRAYFSNDEFLIANSFENVEPATKVGRDELEEMAATIKSSGEYGKGLIGFELVLNKDVLFVSRTVDFVEIEGGEGSFQPGRMVSLPKGTKLFWNTYVCYPENKDVCAPAPS
jgi:hypothetical protein